MSAHVYDGRSIANRTAVGAVWMIGWRMFTRLLGFVSTLILARLLLPADFGLIAIATSLSAGVEALSEVGLRDALVRHSEESPGLTDTAFTMQVVRGLLTAIVIGSSAWFAADWFGDQRLVPLVIILAAVSFASGLENIAVVRFQRELRFDVQFRLLLIPRLLQFAVTIAGAIILRNYWALILGVAVGRILQSVMTYLVYPYRPRLTLCCWRDLVAFSSWAWVSSVLGVLLTRSESFLLAPVLGPAYFGAYFVGVEIGLLPCSEVIAPAASALFAGFALAANKGANTIYLSTTIMAVLIVVVAPFGVGISGTAGYIVAGLLGPTWVASTPVIAVAGLLCILSPIPYVAVMVLTASGYIRRATYAKLGSVLVKLAILLLLPSSITPGDVAAAVTVAFVFECVMFCWQLRACEKLEVRPALGATARSLAAGCITAACLWATGLGWQKVTMTAVPALAIGVPTASMAVVISFSAHYLLWRVAGCPDGPETKVLQMAASFVGHLRTRFRLAAPDRA